MSAAMRAALHQMAIALVYVWFWQAGRGNSFQAYVYGKDVNHMDLESMKKRIVVTVQIEGIP